MPRELGTDFVMVNIPDFTLAIIREGAVVFRAKTVVGKPTQPTPLLSAAMRSITINPVWNVPQSIVENEYMPALKEDPDLFARLGLQTVPTLDGKLHVYQLPGNDNVLGRARFNFPNRFLVYQHDTPETYLFEQSERAYSHGCIRVENAFDYAEALLSIATLEKAYTKDRLRRMVGDEEFEVEFSKPIPVHLTYQTAFVDDGGHMNLRPDIYGRDAKILERIKSDQRSALAQPRHQADRSVAAQQDSSFMHRLTRWAARGLARFRHVLGPNEGGDRPDLR
jgi:murein L,D-transpeptidase YcbB/YkuD